MHQLWDSRFSARRKTSGRHGRGGKTLRLLSGCHNASPQGRAKRIRHEQRHYPLSSEQTVADRPDAKASEGSDGGREVEKLALSILDFATVSFRIIFVSLALFLVTRGLVRAIAERLVPGEAAHANENRFLLRFDFKRLLVCFYDFAHVVTLTLRLGVASGPPSPRLRRARPPAREATPKAFASRLARQAACALEERLLYKHSLD